MERSREGIHYPDPPVFLSVVEVFGVDGLGPKSLGCGENGGVPIRYRVSLGQLYSDTDQPMVNGLTRKLRQLLDPVKCLCGRERARRFPNDCDEEFLEDLG